MPDIQTVKDEIGYLPDFEREDPILLQDIGQTVGWQISAFNLPEIWNLSRGAGVKVAVLDTGCDLNHPDLVKNLLPGCNFITPGFPPEDDNSHGTHVAGIIAADNNELGIVGVAPEAKIMPVKVLGRMGSGRMADVVKGIRWAVENGADIITMSLGTRNPLDEVLEAIKYADEKGVVCFVAAGNAGSTKQLLYPAAYTNVISIGAVDENSFRADFSCTGPNLDFVAPGVRIYSTVPGPGYAFLSGTSMAAPFAVGVAALLLSYERTLEPTKRLSVSDYRRIFREKAMDVKNLDQALDHQGKKFFQGMGIIRPDQFQDWVEIKKVQEISNKIRRLIEDIRAVNAKDKLIWVKEKSQLIPQVIEEELAEGVALAAAAKS